MQVHKKLGRFKQWAGERMGGEAKTLVPEDLKSMETEMSLRQDGLDKLHRSTGTYLKNLSKRTEGEDHEKTLCISGLGSTMVAHGQEFEEDSEFGRCLQSLGRANERIGRIQEMYVQEASQSWLEPLERSLAEMRDFNAARKRLESRRLAYDAAQSKLQRAKRDDFKSEHETRSAKIKYDESCEEIYNRMIEIRESEADSTNDLGALVDAELRYYDQCRSVLLSMKESWPASSQRSTEGSEGIGMPFRSKRTESNSPERPTRSAIISIRKDSASQSSMPTDHSRPPSQRSALSYEGSSHRLDPTFLGARTASDSRAVQRMRSSSRGVTGWIAHDSVEEDQEGSNMYVSCSRRPESPATSHGSTAVSSRASSLAGVNHGAEGTRSRRPPPPPVPSRKTKPVPSIDSLAT